ncbi:hypothetical protein DXG01_013633 [Tephrocybe rancida]|nr:hypothetical protein DXG01_013633 [Tephrocybe rancida]
MDPSSVDFRAFYPYTPNEVKHRKRTTTTQLRTLEAVFKRDTKPNGPLRVELAAQLGMTARGVQVWFQNRRAKEKVKASKTTKADDDEDQDLPESPDEDKPSSLPPSADKRSLPAIDIPKSQASSKESSNGGSVSPPGLQVVTAPAHSSWEEANVDPHSLYAGHNLHAYRRGSLPVNAFPTDFSPDSPSLDDFDPLTRRRSVDTSLQRLANNPYAPLARAKNGAIYGPRAMAPIRRPFCRTPYNPTPRITSSASMPYRLDMRRASLGNFRISPQSTASPSPSPLSPYNEVRASLPDHSLYAVSSRTVSPPLPGPLPSPNFSFGAASTPSMVSGSSGDSERYSPEPPHSYSYRESEQDEDEGTPASYYSLSRFGSIASIATSDSSVNSAYFPEHVGCYQDNQDVGVRRGSCASGHFASLMSGLDVTGQDGMSPHDHPVYTLHENTHVAEVLTVVGKGAPIDSSTYPSPCSTVSPGGSPHPQGTPSSVPISRSSELNHALQSQSGQVPTLVVEQQPFVSAPPPATLDSQVDVNVSGEQYFYTQDTCQMQAASGQAPVELNKYNYSYDGPFLTDSYPLLEGDNLALQHQAFDTSAMSYDNIVHFDTTGQNIDQSYLYA